MKKCLLATLLGIILLASCKSKPNTISPESLPRLAVLPFISGDAIEDDLEETFAWQLANVPEIQKFYLIVPITPQIRKNIKQEQTYNSAFEAGTEVYADFVMVTFVRSIGNQWFFYIMIMNVKTKELITGDCRKFDYLDEISQCLASMVTKMMNVVSHKKQNMPKLAVDVFKLPPINNLKPDTATALTQILASEMANNSMFSIFPRTDNIDMASMAYEKEQTSSKDAVVDTSYLTAAEYVLSCKISSLTSPPAPPFDMLGEILLIDNNQLIAGSHISFDAIEDAPEYMAKLAKALSGSRR
ncbi:MAG: hypothetical protein LBH50_02960 [Spirochaetaceae bacterium]|jgi:hypothetical protein|nr:hypothetical protein [Spirochaetaceae bacterium]